MIKIIIPGEPVAKARPRLSNGHTYTPAKTKHYEALIKKCWQDQSNEHLTGPLSLHLTAYFSIPKSKSRAERKKMAIGEKRPTQRPYLDNIIKTIDALNGLAFDDDSQIVEVVAEKYYSQEPRVEITINSL